MAFRNKSTEKHDWRSRGKKWANRRRRENDRIEAERAALERPDGFDDVRTESVSQTGESSPDFLLQASDDLDVAELSRLCARYQSALRRIAAPRRPDGTYNLGREACEQIARRALADD